MKACDITDGREEVQGQGWDKVFLSLNQNEPFKSSVIKKVLQLQRDVSGPSIVHAHTLLPPPQRREGRCERGGETGVQLSHCSYHPK